LVNIFAVGVGPGSSDYLTEVVSDIIKNCDVIIGYKYTLKTIEHLLDGKQVHEITMNDQEEVYQKIAKDLGDKKISCSIYRRRQFFRV